MRGWASLTCLCAALTVMALGGCAKHDGSMILGQWHAERFDLMGLKLPIGPDLTIGRDKLSMQDRDIPITAIEQDNDAIVLDITGGIGLTFHVVDADKIYIDLPLVDRIYYRRMKAGGAATSAPAETRQRAAMVPAPAPIAGPVAAAELRTVEPSPVPAYAPVYDAAVQAARQGQRDVALRYLHQAVREGFDQVDLLEREAGFEALKSDPRYQVIVLNLPKR